MSREYHSIAIDGPSGAGKSTLSEQLAKAIGYLHVDTGAIYRTVGLAACRRNIQMGDTRAIAEILPELDVELCYGEDGTQRMLLNGEDVTLAIRYHEISAWASVVSAIPEVRAFLLEMQRKLAREHNVIMDGRDIGTVVLPGADVKIFLTATPEDRAMRRYLELKERGTPQDYNKLLTEIRERDYNDSHRSAAPLRPAEDAVVLDTTGNTFEQSFQLLLHTIEERL